MKRNIYILSILFFVLSWSINAQQRIIGGSNANISEAPWQVFIQIDNGDFGGGSIISSNLILTAKHVVEKASPSQIKVGAGISKLSELNASNMYEVSNVIFHPTLYAALLISKSTNK